jgi:hypothetical protein
VKFFLALALAIFLASPATAFPSLCAEYQRLNALCHKGQLEVCAERLELAKRMSKYWDHCNFVRPSARDDLDGCYRRDWSEKMCRMFR